MYCNDCFSLSTGRHLELWSKSFALNVTRALGAAASVNTKFEPVCCSSYTVLTLPKPSLCRSPKLLLIMLPSSLFMISLSPPKQSSNGSAETGDVNRWGLQSWVSETLMEQCWHGNDSNKAGLSALLSAPLWEMVCLGKQMDEWILSPFSLSLCLSLCLCR